MIRFLDTSLSVSLRDSEYTSKDQFCRCVRPHLTNPLWLPQVLNQGHQCTCFSHVRAGALTYTSPHPFDTLVTGMNQPTVHPPLVPPPLPTPLAENKVNFLISIFWSFTQIYFLINFVITHPIQFSCGSHSSAGLKCNVSSASILFTSNLYTGTKSFLNFWYFKNIQTNIFILDIDMWMGW